MAFFNNDIIYPCTFKSVPDGMGGFIKGYVKGEPHEVEAQPISEESIQELWGNKIESKIQVFDDYKPLFLKPGDILVYLNKTYTVEQMIPWDTYCMYAIKTKDILLIESN